MGHYVVSGAYATAPVSSDQGTVILGFHRGAVLPGSVPQENIDHLLDVGLVTEVADPENTGIEVYPPPEFVSPVGVVVQDSTLTTVASTQAEAEQPAGNASHEQWVEYAVAKGMPREEAEASTRDELRDKYRA